MFDTGPDSTRPEAVVAPSGTEQLDTHALELAVKRMYERVAEEPFGEFHFETGRALAERLGYDPTRLEASPRGAVDSFAGVGHHFELAALEPGERVVDLGSGSGMDAFVAATFVGSQGHVCGVDMTRAQRDKATALRDAAPGFENVEFYSGYIEALSFADESVDCVISNGVINLVADKARVFSEAARVLEKGGRLAISDIVTAQSLPESVVCNVDLWASCIGGAMRRDEYQAAIESAGLVVELVQLNPQYRFLPGGAQRSADRYEVQSLSLVARKA